MTAWDGFIVGFISGIAALAVGLFVLACLADYLFAKESAMTHVERDEDGMMIRHRLDDQPGWPFATALIALVLIMIVIFVYGLWSILADIFA